MIQYNFPTTILCGEGALAVFVDQFARQPYRHPLIVSDATLLSCGLVQRLTDQLEQKDIAFSVFTETDPNPVEANIENGTAVYRQNVCDSIIAIGGGSPIDAGKAIRIMAVHPPPLAQYDDALGGDQLITEPMPPLYAVPTTAGTGSEVGRSAVIIMAASGKKTIFFHPDLTPDIAVLDPELTIGLPPAITAATGIDAFVHNLEAYLASGFHPMADGIALEGMALVLDWLPLAVREGENMRARERMLLAAAMGATAFQKGLGMIHSLAHPLSSRKGLHHGLANALLLPDAIAFLENSALRADQRSRLDRVHSLFKERGQGAETLSRACAAFLDRLGIDTGLAAQGVSTAELEALSLEAYEDPCHATNMISVTQQELHSIYTAALR